MRGIIQFLHLSDAVVSDPQERFKVGTKIRTTVSNISPNVNYKQLLSNITMQSTFYQVLAIESDRDQLLLTAKKSLMNPSHPILGSANMLNEWDKIQVARRAGRTSNRRLIVTAYVVHTSDKGVLVSGMDNMRGWIPRRETFVDETQSMDKFFSRGQTVELRILKRLAPPPPGRSAKNSSEFLLSQKVSSSLRIILKTAHLYSLIDYILNSSYSLR